MRSLLKVGLLFILSYLSGCLNGAYYSGKIVSKQDIRELGSSNAGARNAGRVLGRSVFIYTVIIDALKTIIPLAIAFYLFHGNEFLVGILAVAVLLGHIWPVQLQFRGGKGVVVYLAAALTLAPLTLIVAGLTLVAGLMIRRNFTMTGLLALTTIPLMLIILSKFILSGLFLIMLLIVLIVHRKGN